MKKKLREAGLVVDISYARHLNVFADKKRVDFVHVDFVAHYLTIYGSVFCLATRDSHHFPKYFTIMHLVPFPNSNFLS